MKQINENYEQIIAKYKSFINELSAVQDDYFSSLKEELDFNQKDGEFLFDYVYNSTEEEGSTFAGYMARFSNHESENAK